MRAARHRTQHSLIALAACLAVTVSMGCSTIETFTKDWSSKWCTYRGYERPALPWTYSGTRWAWFVWSHSLLLSDLYALDLPLSAVADTLALPYTIPRQLIDGDLAPHCDRPDSPGKVDEPLAHILAPKVGTKAISGSAGSRAQPAASEMLGRDGGDVYALQTTSVD